MDSDASDVNSTCNLLIKKQYTKDTSTRFLFSSKQFVIAFSALCCKCNKIVLVNLTTNLLYLLYLLGSNTEHSLNVTD